MKLQLNGVDARACKFCSLLHPFTPEFWFYHSERFRCKIAEKHRAKIKTQRNYPTKIVKASRFQDKKKQRYEPKNYIDNQWVLDTQKKQKDLCHYCHTTMVYGVGINRQTNREGLTVERLDNNKGHNKDNCVLCHKKCQRKNHPNNKVKIVIC